MQTIYSRGWWRPKRGRLLTPGRCFHAAIAYVAVLAGASLFGEPGLAVASLGVVALGWAWEAISPLIPWPHPWGDVIDFCAFEVGQLAGVVLWYAVQGGIS